MTRTVYTIDRSSGAEIPLATFELQDEHLVATYHDEDYRRTIEDVGLLLVVDGEERTLRPKDGRVFVENLERGHWQSQVTFVRTESERSPPIELTEQLDAASIEKLEAGTPRIRISSGRPPGTK